jgi:adenylylsulfate kinase-like enzyme|tara:strand:- start:4941 stop:5405 length:465 start_codon:yes stop_codon:yes gene_type:complete
MIYILYGQPGSGKTTLAKLLKDHLTKEIIASAVYSPKLPVIIDGDEFRKVFKLMDYSRKGREDNISAANTVATYISKVESKDVIMALVNPYEHLRKELKNNNQDKVIEIFLQSSRDLRKEYHVEDFEIGDPEYALRTDAPVDKSWCNFKKLLEL